MVRVGCVARNACIVLGAASAVSLHVAAGAVLVADSVVLGRDAVCDALVAIE